MNHYTWSCTSQRAPSERTRKPRSPVPYSTGYVPGPSGCTSPRKSERGKDRRGEARRGEEKKRTKEDGSGEFRSPHILLLRCVTRFTFVWLLPKRSFHPIKLLREPTVTVNLTLIEKRLVGIWSWTLPDWTSGPLKCYMETLLLPPLVLYG